MRNTSQRRAIVLSLLTEKGAVQLPDLVDRLGVSAVTIRNDLRALVACGLANRSHGGAVRIQASPAEHSIDHRDTLHLEQKNRIGTAAAALVREGDNIIIDSGTTTVSLARHMCDKRAVAVMTNGLNIAMELAGAPGINLLLTGGRLRRCSLSIQGGQAEACLQVHSFDKLFLGVDGFDLQFGITTHDETEASLNYKMVECAKKVIVLTDASKFGKVGLHRIVPLDRIDAVITDSGISGEYREGLQKLGIELFIA